MDSGWQRSGPWMESRRNGWTYRLMVGADQTPEGFVDVHAFSPTGDHWVGTIGTVSAVEERLAYYQTSGECLSGSYFWTAGLVIVTSMDPKVLLDVLAGLAGVGELQSAFEDTASDG